jgi:hypothetical protein
VPLEVRYQVHFTLLSWVTNPVDTLWLGSLSSCCLSFFDIISLRNAQLLPTGPVILYAANLPMAAAYRVGLVLPSEKISRKDRKRGTGVG